MREYNHGDTFSLAMAIQDTIEKWHVENDLKCDLEPHFAIKMCSHFFDGLASKPVMDESIRVGHIYNKSGGPYFLVHKITDQGHHCHVFDQRRRFDVDGIYDAKTLLNRGLFKDVRKKEINPHFFAFTKIGWDDDKGLIFEQLETEPVERF